jgi:uncharacterized protein (TIGR02757 family)
MSRTAAKREKMRETLEDLYERYNDRSLVSPDPLSFLYGYEDTADREIVGLIASVLAFGTVKQIAGSIERALEPLGKLPSAYLDGSTAQEIRNEFSRFGHRWITGDDFSFMLLGAKRARAEYGSLETCFLSGYDDAHGDIVLALEHFVETITRNAVFSCSGMVPSPRKSSACKRWNLFLRWMIRCDAVDPGGWRGIPTSKLVVPLDTHMHRFGMALGFTERRQPDMRTALEITEGFREIAPHDPVKYDFALTRLGIRRDSDRRDFLERLGIRDTRYA